MPNLINSNALTFDDVLLVPQFSDVKSRKDVDTSTDLLGINFSIPICSANMDTITEALMASTMYQLGGLGILHRYANPSLIKQWIFEIKSRGGQVVPSIGIKNEDFQLAQEYAKLGATAINIDIAHGDSTHMVYMVERLQNLGIKVIAGNVASYTGALRLARAGADVIKVGVGPGAVCTTRIVTGHGVPQLTAIEECARIKEQFPNVRIIADGGIRNSGDCVKALAFGADMIMIGSLLAGTTETPGEIANNLKQYRGMASKAARSSVALIDPNYVAEGEATIVPFKGPAENVINQLIGGIRSGMSYSGAKTLTELRSNAEYVIMSNNGMAESRPHGVTYLST